MKKILAIFIILFSLAGCGVKTPKTAVEDYLRKYKTLNSEVLVDMEQIIDKENLTKEQKDLYRDILKKQYKDLSYEIVDEEIDGDNSYVTAKIKVYDLYKAQSDANKYLEEHREEFNDENGNYSATKFMDYRLKNMKNTNDFIEYTITFSVSKENDTYVVAQPTDNDLLKIHGIYNYELD